MAASLKLFPPPPPRPSLQRRRASARAAVALPLVHHSYNAERLLEKLGLLSTCVRPSLKSGCTASKELAVTAKDSQSYKMRGTPDMYMGGMDDFERQLEELFNEVKTMLKLGNKDDALDLLQANYELVKVQIDAGSKGIQEAATLDVIALGYVGAGNFTFVEHILEMLNDIIGGLHNNMPLLDSILLHMGSMYASLGKLEEAKIVFERSLEILDEEYGNQSPFLISPLLGISKVLGMMGRSTKAMTMYHRALGILELSRGTESEELVIPLFGLGNLLIKEGKAADAETCFSRILRIYTKAYGEKDGRVGMAMCSLAHAKCAEGSVQEATYMYRRGLCIIKESNYMALDDDILEKMRIDFAELLHVAGREKEGRQLLEECLQITEKRKGVGHPSTVAHFLNLATSYSRSKDFVEAERLLRTCLHIMSKSMAADDPSITAPMLQLAEVLYQLKQDEEAEKLALEAIHIRESAFGKESLPVGEALDCLVSIQTRMGEKDADLLAMLKRILNIQEKEFGYKSEEVMTTLKKIIFYLDKMGKRAEKLPLQRRLSLLRTEFKERVPI